MRVLQHFESAAYASEHTRKTSDEFSLSSTRVVRKINASKSWVEHARLVYLNLKSNSCFTRILYASFTPSPTQVLLHYPFQVLLKFFYSSYF